MKRIKHLNALTKIFQEWKKKASSHALATQDKYRVDNCNHRARKSFTTRIDVLFVPLNDQGFVVLKVEYDALKGNTEPQFRCKL